MTWTGIAAGLVAVLAVHLAGQGTLTRWELLGATILVLLVLASAAQIWAGLHRRASEAPLDHDQLFSAGIRPLRLSFDHERAARIASRLALLFALAAIGGEVYLYHRLLGTSELTRIIGIAERALTLKQGGVSPVAEPEVSTEISVSGD